jgi:hypothetical protein
LRGNSFLSGKKNGKGVETGARIIEYNPGIKGERPLGRDLIARGSDRLAPANRTSAGSTQTVSFFKNETASFAPSGIHPKFLGTNRFSNMLKMIEDFSLADPK